MTKQAINVGTTANDKKGDSLRAAFQKVNANFTELYTALGLDAGGLNIGAFEFAGSVMSTTDSTAITIDQAVTVASNLTVGGDVIPSVANGGDLGSAAKPWRSLHVSSNTLFIGGTAVAVNGNGQLTVNGSTVVGPQGATGAAGATGATGATGAVGAVGAVGATGAAAGPNISSEGDVSIEINLTDSTLRRWSFGEDGVLNLAGNLQFADGTNQTTAYQTSIVRAQREAGGTSTSDLWTFTTISGAVSGEWVADASAAYPALGLGSNPYIIFTLTGFTKPPGTFYKLLISGGQPILTNTSDRPQLMTNATSPNILTAFNPTLHKFAFSEGTTIATDIYWEFRI